MTGKGIQEGSFNFRMMNKHYCEVNKKVYVCYIDYEKVSYQINHDKLTDCLKAIGKEGKDI